MRVTNLHDLPQPLYEALANDPYESVGDISATGLIKPPLMRRLERLYDAELEEDASDRVWRLFGQSVHAVIERHGGDNRLTEERLTREMCGWTVSGKPDLLDADGVLTDYKVTSVFAFLLGDKPEWDAQLNIYAWLYRRHGFDVNQLQIVAILRDWMERRAAAESAYPQCNIHRQVVPLWRDEMAEIFIRARIALHQEAERCDPDLIPLCSKDERWEKPTTYAVKKAGNKRAMPGGVHESREAAEAFAANQTARCEIETRPGEATRCARYCVAAKFCRFGKVILAHLVKEEIAEHANA